MLNHTHLYRSYHGEKKSKQAKRGFSLALIITTTALAGESRWPRLDAYELTVGVFTLV